MPKKKDELEAICDEWLASWTGTDEKPLVRCYTEDCYYQDPANPDGINGRKALAEYFAKLLAKNPNMTWKREALYPIPDGFTLKWKAELPCPQRTVHTEGLDIVLLDGGKISHNEVYFDPTPWRQALSES